MDERNPDGSNTLRHREAAAARTVAPGDEQAHEAIAEVIGRRIGVAPNVLHEIVSDRIHVDVHVVPPTSERPVWTCYTTGLSDLPMTIPAGARGQVQEYAELIVELPGEWKMEHEAWSDERWYFPIRWLKQLARLPHDYGTWLGDGHTIPNGDPAKPLAPGVPQTGWLVHYAYDLEDDAIVKVRPDKHVALLRIMPLYPDEMDFKLREGLDALFKRFDAAKVSWTVDVARPSALGRKKFLGLF
jgi:hypothetical protein